MKVDLAEDIKFSLESFSFSDMYSNSLNFLKTLGIESQRRYEENNYLPSEFLKQFDPYSVIDKKHAHFNSWKEIGLIFQYSNSEIKSVENIFKSDLSNQNIQSILFFFITLKNFPYKKKFFREISYELNRIFKMPCFILFKYINFLAISITEKRPSKINIDSEIIDGIYVVKNINYLKPNEEFLDFIRDLSLYSILKNNHISNFEFLIKVWKDLFIKINNKKILDQDSLLERAKLCFEKGAYEYSIAICNKLIKNDPLMYTALEIRASCLFYLQSTDDAYEDCEFVLSHDPYNLNMNNLLSLLENDELINL